MSDPFERFMRDSDAFSWYMEKDPVLRSTIVAVAWLDGSPDWDRLVAKVDRATRELPMFRQRLVEPPARLAPPRWMVDPSFDLSWHLRHLDAPRPGTAASVIGVARTAAMSAFDPARPLWEFTLVDNLEDGRAALVIKVHHSLTDGVSGMEMALRLFDLEPDAVPDGPAPPPLQAETWSAGGLVRDCLAYDWHRVSGFVRHEASEAIPAAARLARHPRQTIDELVSTARSVGRTVAPVSDTLSPVMTGRGLSRHLDMISVPVADLKAAAAAAGGTINDGFIGAVTGGLRRYHQRHGVEPGDLRVTLPISIRKAGDPIGGNRITLIRFKVPVASIPDPAQRIAAVHRSCRAARDERSLPLTGAIAGTLNLLPAGAISGMLKHVDFVASDVPGFPFPVHLAGARMDGYYAFGPTIGTAFNATLLSYNGTSGIGITVDTDAVRDPDVFTECLGEGFAEVLALGGRRPHVKLPLAAGRRGSAQARPRTSTRRSRTTARSAPTRSPVAAPG